MWEPPPSDVAGTARCRRASLRRPPAAGRPLLRRRRRRSLLFNGHIDVVPVEPEERWRSDPFGAVVRDGKLYGRGACDMKGGVAAMVLAAETLAASASRSPATSSSARSPTRSPPAPAGSPRRARREGGRGHRPRADGLRRLGRLPRHRLPDHHRPGAARARRAAPAALAGRRGRERDREGPDRARGAARLREDWRRAPLTSTRTWRRPTSCPR